MMLRSEKLEQEPTSAKVSGGVEKLIALGR